MVHHDRVGVFDAADDLVLARGVQGHDVGDFAQHAALGFQRAGDEIGNHDARTLAHRDVACCLWSCRGQSGHE